MECRDCQPQIDQYLAGTLSADDLAAFADHIDHCQYCRDQIDSYKDFNELVNQCDIIIPSVDITKAVMDKIRTGTKTVQPLKPVKRQGIGRARFLSLLQDLVAAAAAAIIIFWLSGPVLARAEVPQYSKEVAKVSNSVGLVFQSYLNFYDHAIKKLSNSVNEMDRGQSKGVEGF